MNMKLKLLAGTVSLLCVSQVSMADVTSTIVLNGSSHTFTAPTLYDALHPDFATLAPYFPINGGNATSGVGLVDKIVDSANPDKSFIVSRDSGKSVTVQALTNGQTTDFVVISAPTVNKTTEAVNAYISNALTAKTTYPTIITPATKDFATFTKAVNSIDTAATKVLSANVSPNATATEAAVDSSNLSAFTTAAKTTESSIGKYAATVPSSANYVIATVALNGVTHNYTYESADKMWADLNTPADNQNDFINNGVKPTTTTGMVTEVTSNGQTYTTVRVDTNSMLIGTQQADGTFKFVEVKADDTNKNVNKNARAYIEGNTALGLTPSEANVRKAIDMVRAGEAAKGVPATALGAYVQAEKDLLGLLPAPPQPKITQQDIANALQTTGATIQRAANAIDTTKVRGDVATALNPLTNLQKKYATDPTSVSQTDLDNATAAAKALADQLERQMRTAKYSAATSRSSGIAGNPISAMNTTVDSMFYQVADYGQATKANLGSNALFSGTATLQYGYYDLDGRTAHAVNLPLSFSGKLGSRGELVLTVPLSYIQVQNQSDAYQVGAILGYRYHVNDHWDITPAATYTYRNFDSRDWNNAMRRNTSMVGGTVSSKYTWDWQPMSIKIAMTNMVGYVQSLDTNATPSGLGGPFGVSRGDNNVSSYVTKNGLHLTKGVGNMVVGVYFTDTEYFGAKRALYYDQFNEAGFSLKPQGLGAAVDALSLDANYLFNIGGNHQGNIDGFRVNLGYKF